MKEVQCKEVIISTLGTRGKGTDHNPVRRITEVFEKDGTKIAEHDPSPETFTKTDLVNFSRWMKTLECDPEKISTLAVDKWLDTI